MIATHYANGVPICFGDVLLLNDNEDNEALRTVAHPRDLLQEYPQADIDKEKWIPVYDPPVGTGAAHINGYEPKYVTLIHRTGVELRFEEAYPGDLVRLEKDEELHQFVVGDYEEDGGTNRRTLYATGHAGSYNESDGWKMTRLTPPAFTIAGFGYLTMETMLTGLT